MSVVTLSLLVLVGSLTMSKALTVAELAGKPFVQRAMSNPTKPSSVLSFYYGLDFEDDSHVLAMKDSGPLETMTGIWYGGGEEHDEMCRSFAPTIRELADPKSRLSTAEEWSRTMDGHVGKILLFDQLSRNSFRGTDEAFAYDGLSEQLTLQLLESQMPAERIPRIEGTDEPEAAVSVPDHLRVEAFPPYLLVCFLPLMHSESAASHHLGASAIEWCIEEKFASNESLRRQFEYTKTFLDDHTRVIDRFGRYPHRNAKLGRESTPEETEWLNDTDNLPGWASSQG